MSKALELWNKLALRLKADKRRPRGPIALRGDGPEKPPIEPQKDYVDLRINQLFLRDARQWFTTIEPVVYASTEFLYGGTIRVDPFVVGPRKEDHMPAGMCFKNIGVFGPHPYRGGKLTWTIVLAQMPVRNVARDMLDVIEAAGKAIDPGASFDMATKIGGVVLDGFERLMGLSGVSPLLGVRQQVDADAGDKLRPGFHALIDADDPDPTQLWVTDGELLYGPTRELAKPYREADFVLFEIAGVPNGMRSDTDRLPFNDLWERARESAGRLGKDAWDDAKANMAALASALYRSPDLTFAQAEALRETYVRMLKAVHAATEQTALLGGGEAVTVPAVGDIMQLP